MYLIYLSPWGKLIGKAWSTHSLPTGTQGWTADRGFEREIAMPSLRPEVSGSSFGTACAGLCRSCKEESIGKHWWVMKLMYNQARMDWCAYWYLLMTNVRYTVEWSPMIHNGYISSLDEQPNHNSGAPWPWHPLPRSCQGALIDWEEVLSFKPLFHILWDQAVDFF